MKVACFYFSSPVEVEKIAEDVLRFSPQIAVKVPDAVFVEIGKCHRLYSEEEFVAKAAILFRRMDIPVAIGMGNSIEWALLSAKFGSSQMQQLAVESLFDLADPLARDEKSRPFVAKLVKALGDLGVKTLAQFKAVPRRELAVRFGPVGLLCRQKLDDELMTPWKPWIPPEVIAEAQDYMYSDFQVTLEPLLFEAKKLLDRIFVRLRFRGLKACALSISIKCEKLSINPTPERELAIEFLLPQAETKGALAILRDFLTKEFDKRPLLTPLEQFSITVTRSTAGFMGQKNLYHSREERKEAYAAFVSRLAQTYGKGSTYKAQTVEERLPEFSWEKVAQITKQADLKGRIPLRPTHLLKPQKVEIAGEFIHIQKKRFRILRRDETIERISCRWLGELVERTYFQLEVEDGPLLWIYKDHVEKYYLHGFYG